MAKRGKGEGTIYQRKDKRWYAQITTPQGRKGFYGKSRAEVQRKRQDALAGLAKGLPLVDGRQTLKTYLLAWLDGVESEIRSSSFGRYQDIVRLHLIPALGHLPLAQLGPQQVKSFYSQKAKSGLSSTTVRHMHSVLHRALKDAERMGLVQINATERVKAPRRDHKEMQTLSEDQANQLLEAAEGHRYEALFLLALTTGMREGELLSLHWGDVDLQRGRLTVRYNASRTTSGYRVLETKTSYSRRTIGLSRTAVAALRTHRTRQKAERLAALCWEENDLVFPGPFGRLLLPPNFVRLQFKPLLIAAGLPPIRFHDLRHTCATIAIARGDHIKAVSEMLGHSSITITLSLYAHVTPHMHQAIADTMDAVFGRRA